MIAIYSAFIFFLGMTTMMLTIGLATCVALMPSSDNAKMRWVIGLMFVIGIFSLKVGWQLLPK